MNWKWLGRSWVRSGIRWRLTWLICEAITITAAWFLRHIQVAVPTQLRWVDATTKSEKRLEDAVRLPGSVWTYENCPGWWSPVSIPRESWLLMRKGIRHLKEELNSFVVKAKS